jgi:hypothetical protein
MRYTPYSHPLSFPSRLLSRLGTNRNGHRFRRGRLWLLRRPPGKLDRDRSLDTNNLRGFLLPNVHFLPPPPCIAGGPLWDFFALILLLLYIISLDFVKWFWIKKKIIV